MQTNIKNYGSEVKVLRRLAAVIRYDFLIFVGIYCNKHLQESTTVLLKRCFKRKWEGWEIGCLYPKD